MPVEKSVPVEADDDVEDEEQSTEAATRSDRTTSTTSPSKSEIFDLMSSHRRRFAIHYCKDQEGPVELSDLAEHVAARELDKEIVELTSDERKRVYTSLQQTHLPRLERAGMITDDNGRIELTDQIADMEIYLDIVPGQSVPWGVYYLGLSAISGVVLLLLYLDILPTETLPQLGWIAIILVIFTVSAIIHTLSNREYRLEQLDNPSE